MAYGVLILEDEASLARNIKAYLEEEGFEAKVAGDGETGLRLRISRQARGPERAVPHHRARARGGAHSVRIGASLQPRSGKPDQSFATPIGVQTPR